MYVCSCNGHRESDLRAAANRGVQCARQAYALLGREPRCGKCLDLAQQIIDDACADVTGKARGAG